ncbi:MAG: hypothetical protein IH944_01970 [Armatimonadetes bacterium]|nr:hypothetical protein [Armatimonadota bacterium]
MGRAWQCPKCSGTKIRTEKLTFNNDLWSICPRTELSIMYLFCCTRCHYGELIHPGRLTPPRFCVANVN